MSYYINTFPQISSNNQGNSTQNQSSCIPNSIGNFYLYKPYIINFNGKTKSLTSRKKFTSEEDEKLKQLVKKHGIQKWERIAKKMPGRTGRQCRDRYMNYLVSGIFTGQWTKKEDELLLEKYLELGPKWSQIKQFFTNRNANSLKNRWNYYISKHLNYDEFLKVSNIENIHKKDLTPNNDKQQSQKEECINNINNIAWPYQ